MPLSVAELEARLRAVLPEVRLVSERQLRKILHALDDEDELIAINPELPLWIERERLRRYGIVPEPLLADAGDQVLLLTKPDDRFSTNPPDDVLLRAYWRMMVRACVFAEARKHKPVELGPGVELEARFVLEADHIVPHGVDAATVHAAFMAWSAELALFDPGALKWVFPTLAASRPEVPWWHLYAKLRPLGAADRDEKPEKPTQQAQPLAEGTQRGGLLARADHAAQLGNHVRAAILRTRAGASGWPPLREGLVPRLRRVLSWDDDTTNAWVRALGALVKPAAAGVWSRAARALYDLQRIPSDLEGELSIVDPIEWLRLFGRRPLRRTLTRARGVVLLRHLSKAQRHLERAHIDADDRARLIELIDAEKQKVEQQVRAELAPVIGQVLNQAGFRSANLPEEVARDKVVAELLDRICENGFLRFGDLRDAIARNNLKMPDLSGPWELLQGDALLRADRMLGDELDGVYHSAEIYLRWIQRGAAVSFGTGIGRWLSKYVAFPFGGAFVAVEFGKYVIHEAGALIGLIRGVLPHEEEDAALIDELGTVVESIPDVAESVHHGIAVTPTSLAITVALGCVFLGVLYWPAFRAIVWSGLKGLGRGFRYTFVALPVLVWRSAPVRAVRHHPLTRFLGRHFGIALLVAVLVALVLVLIGAGPRRVVRWSAIAFGLVAVFLNSPFGRRLEDDVAEALADLWRVVRINLIPGIVSWVVWAFRALASVFERVLYSFDEWFRFREGQSRPNLVGKAVLAVLWFPIAYLIRFVFYLLVEPQVNPVKHFPVVTVSHKVIWPLVPQLADWTGLSPWTVGTVINGIPGIFGFIAWELKENWRLYAANRPDTLTPVPLGHHGETMRGLLRPGFHSGTVPALYRKLRMALRRADWTRKPPRTDRYEHGLDEVAHAIEVFLRREFLPLLNAAECWHGLTTEVGWVEIRVQSILVELLIPRFAGLPLRLAFEHRSGIIETRIEEPGWYGRLNPEQNRIADTALSGVKALAAATGPDASDSPDWIGWVRFWETVRRPGSEYRR